MHALKTKTPEEVAKVLIDIFWDKGAPTKLLSDDGRNKKRNTGQYIEIIAVPTECSLRGTIFGGLMG